MSHEPAHFSKIRFFNNPILYVMNEIHIIQGGLNALSNFLVRSWDGAAILLDKQ